MAIQKIGNEVDLEYTIIGDSNSGNEKLLIKRIIQKWDLSNFVRLEGYIPRTKLNKFFQSNNVGVSYIPVIDYYNDQPPTKTFEYLSSGMSVIATNNKINMEIINKDNGVLIDSNASSFCKGIIDINKNLGRYNFRKIYDSSSNYQWKNIIRNTLQPLISGDFK